MNHLPADDVPSGKWLPDYFDMVSGPTTAGGPDSGTDDTGDSNEIRDIILRPGNVSSGYTFADLRPSQQRSLGDGVRRSGRLILHPAATDPQNAPTDWGRLSRFFSLSKFPVEPRAGHG
jgi:hypothetical protein